MSNLFSKFYKNSSKKIKELKKTIDQLKKENEKEEKRREKILSHPPHDKKRSEVEVHFSMMSVAKATIVVIALVVLANFLNDIADVLLIFFVSILFAAALDPTVDQLERYKIPRVVSILVILLLIILIMVFFVSQLIPLLAIQLIELAKNLNGLLNNLGSGESDFLFSETIRNFYQTFIEGIQREDILNQFSASLETFGQQLQSFAGDTFELIKTAFNGIFNFALVLILVFFLVIDEEGVDKFFISLFPSKHGKYIIEKMEAVKSKIGYWLRGQVILIIFMFVLTLIGLLILGVDYALTLAMLAGIAELIPVVGPFIAGVPALLVAFNESPWLALWVFGLIVLLQQIEGNIVVPIVMKKAVGLSPIIVILSMLIGFQTLGILGAIIAIPVTTTLSIFVADYAAKEK
jgi:predicted PurR-regulated permease PerM